MAELHWEARAYDEMGNLVMLVHNPEVHKLVEQMGEQKPMVQLTTKNELFDLAVEEGLSEEAVKIIWGVMPGDMRLKKPLTEEEKQIQREEFKQMLKEARDRVYWNNKGSDGVAERHNEKLPGKTNTPRKRATGPKKEKIVKAAPVVVSDGVW